MKRRAHRLGLLAALAVAAWIVPAGSASAQLPAPGFDLFETDPGSTQFTFQNPGTAIPPNFFGPGSDPFVGQVNFGGIPLQSFGGKSIGDTDTIVQRHAAPPAAAAGIVPIELVELSLQSVQPITVTYNGGTNPEPWAVGVGPSPTEPSLGNIFISEQGSMFDSQLRVIPVFTFTRLSDRTQRVLDAAALPPASKNALIFQQQQAPWRAGCVLPALAVPGINDGFCPALTPQGEKQLTVEQALLASHGVYPAQPALEHFQCYSVRRSRFRGRGVTLTDQFGNRRARVRQRAELCNPVRKNREPFVNRRAHLQCYGVNGPPLRLVVAVQNQFGSQRLLVKSPRRLCVPSEKRIVRRRGRTRPFPRVQTPIDHFQCYSVASRGPLWTLRGGRGVRLNDQFGRRGAQVGQPFQICAPTRKVFRKRVSPLQHPVRHLVCYRIQPRNARRVAQIRNQFERRVVRTRKSFSLCVPSNKLFL